MEKTFADLAKATAKLSGHEIKAVLEGVASSLEPEQADDSSALKAAWKSALATARASIARRSPSFND